MPNFTKDVMGSGDLPAVVLGEISLPHEKTAPTCGAVGKFDRAPAVERDAPDGHDAGSSGQVIGGTR